MDAALSTMAEEFFLVSNNETWPRSISNPERYIKTMLETMEVPIFAEPDPQNFPITDGRCEDGKSFCVVKQGKDCRPKNTSFPVDECKQLYANTGWEEKWKRDAEASARRNELMKAANKQQDADGL